ncbi:MAG TPA: hypothetical protein VGK66_01730 [Solirubrobacterales bacterium]|nr:hypothetical protein [Solirubrobacterales bacterium]
MKGHKQTSSKPKPQPRQKPRQAANPRSASASHPAPPTEGTAEALAEIKDLIGGSGGGKQRTVSNPKQVRELLKELSDHSGHSGDQTSGSQESGSGGSGSQSGVEAILETLGGG